jgi:hypothetical protein
MVVVTTIAVVVIAAARTASGKPQQPLTTRLSAATKPATFSGPSTQCRRY